jgi:hypothetical protein
MEDHRPARSIRMSSKSQVKVITGFLCAVMLFYLWTASTSYNRPFRFTFAGDLGKLGGSHRGENAVDFYNALADAFMAGKTHLLIYPRKELRDLSLSYDSFENYRYGLHDAALYKGKYYLYYGPVPAVALFIPFRFVFGTNIPQDLAVVIFSFGGVLFSVMAFSSLAKAYFPKMPFSLFFSSVVCLSLCNLAPFLLRRPAFYEVAISSGYFFLSGCFYFLFSGGLGKEIRPRRIWLGSLFLGLGVGCRPNLILAAPVLLLVWMRIFREKSGGADRKPIAGLCGVFCPFLLIVFVLGLYNYVRFGSFLETGIGYNRIGGHGIGRSFNFSYLPRGLYFYLFYPCEINFNFPFFHLMRGLPGQISGAYKRVEPVAGIFRNLIFLNIIFAAPFFYKRMIRVARYVTLGILFLVFFSLLNVVVFSALSVVNTMRYLADLVPHLSLAAVLLWAFMDNALAGRKKARMALSAGMITAIAYSCIFSIAISFTGYYDLLRVNNPDIFYSISRFFAI